MGVIQARIVRVFESLIRPELSEVLLISKDINVQTFSLVYQVFPKKGKALDCLKFLISGKVSDHFASLKLEYAKNSIQKIANLMMIIKEHDFSKTNYSAEIYRETREQLIQKISKDVKIQECLKFFVHLTAIDKSYIQCGSNSLSLLVEMKAELKKQNWENIRVKNTSLIGANFAKCILSGSEFENVDMNGVNLNGAILFNCKWTNIRVCEFFKLDDHCAFRSIFFSPDGKSLISLSHNKIIKCWDLKTGKAKFQLNDASAVCISPDGLTLASASGDQKGEVRFIDVRTRKIKIKLIGHGSEVYSVNFSPDGDTLASGSYKSICLWDALTGKFKSRLDGRGDVCFSPDGIYLLSIMVGGRTGITLWNVKKGELLHILNGYYGKSATFSPDGKTIASGSSNSKPKINLWDVQTGQLRSQLDLKENFNVYFQVCFSPDGATLVACSADKSIRIWDVKSGKFMKLLNGHTDAVFSACFSPDGSILASCGDDQTIRLWDGKTPISVDTKNVESVSSHKDPYASVYQIQNIKSTNLIQTKYDHDYSQTCLQLINFANVQLDAMLSTDIFIIEKPVMQAQGALVFQSQFSNHLEMNLQRLLEQKGSIILEKLQK